MTAARTAPRPKVGAPPVWDPPAVEPLVLGNGIEVVACPLPGRELVAVDVVLDAPVHAEPPALEGVAAIMGHALESGTEVRDAQAFAEALEACGATMSTGVGHGGLRASVDVPLRRLPDALALLAEAVVRPTFPEAEVARLVGQRLDQIRQQEADPATLADLRFRAAAVDAAARLSRPARGASETVEAVTRDAVAAFHAAHATPATTRITIGGSLDADAARALLEDAFGAWGNAAGAASAADLVAPPDDPARGPGGPALVERPGSAQTALVIGDVGIDRRAPDWADLVVALHVLGGTLTSRVDAVLREEKGYTYGMRSRARPSRRGGLLIATAGSVQAEVTGDAVAELERILRTSVEGGVTEQEVDEALAYLVGVQPLRFQTARALVEHVTDLRCSDLPPDHLRAQLVALRGVTAASASAALGAHLDPDRLVLAAVGDPAALAALR